MTNQLPPELFSSRPVRSDFGRRSQRRLPIRFLLALLVLAGLGAVLWFFAFSGEEETLPLEEAPVIAPEGETKVRPEDRGGLDVPHQDVLVFEELEEGAKKQEEGGVEHLLPPPETPDLAAAEEVEAKPFPSDKTIRAGAEEESLPPPPADGQPVIRTEKLIEDAKPVYKMVEKKQEEAAEVKTAAPQEETSSVSPITTRKIDVAEPAATAKEEAAKKTQQTAARLPKELFTIGEVPKESPAVEKKTFKIARAPGSEPVVGAAKTETVKTTEKKVEAKVVKPAETAKSSAVTPTPSGKMRRLQLAAFKDNASAKEAIANFMKKHASILGGVTLESVRADLGAKGIYYRVMSTQMSESKAKDICEKLKAKKAACLVK